VSTISSTPAALAAGVDRVGVLPDPLAERLGPGEVGGAHVDAPSGQIIDLVDFPTRGHDLLGGNTALQQRLDGQPAEVTGRAGNDD